MSTDRIGEIGSPAYTYREPPSQAGAAILERPQRSAEVQHVEQVVEQSRSQPAAFTSEHMELIQALVDRVAAYLNRRMDYQIEPKTHAVVVRILDGETQEVVKTIPPEQWIKLAQRFEETIGLLFDELA